MWEFLTYLWDPHFNTDFLNDSTWPQLLKKCVTPKAEGLSCEISGREGQSTTCSQILRINTSIFTLWGFSSTCDLASLHSDTYSPHFWIGSMGWHCWMPGLLSCLLPQLFSDDLFLSQVEGQLDYSKIWLRRVWPQTRVTIKQL